MTKWVVLTILAWLLLTVPVAIVIGHIIAGKSLRRGKQ